MPHLITYTLRGEKLLKLMSLVGICVIANPKSDYIQWLKCNGMQGNAVSPPPIYGSKRSPTLDCYKGKAYNHCRGPKPECSVPPPLILHFNHWLYSATFDERWSLTLRVKRRAGFMLLCRHSLISFVINALINTVTTLNCTVNSTNPAELLFCCHANMPTKRKRLNYSVLVLICVTMHLYTGWSNKADRHPYCFSGVRFFEPPYRITLWGAFGCASTAWAL